MNKLIHPLLGEVDVEVDKHFFLNIYCLESDNIFMFDVSELFEEAFKDTKHDPASD